MPYRVVIAADARQDMSAIYGYIATHDSIATADLILLALQETCGSLREQPSRGKMPAEMQLLGVTAYREIRFKTYRIVYRIEERTVVVYGVADGRRDMQSFLHHRLVR